MKSKLHIKVKTFNSPSTAEIVRIHKFSDSTVQVVFDPKLELQSNVDLGKTSKFNTIIVSANIKCSDGIMALVQLKDILDNVYPTHVKVLDLKYLPYARYDRRMFDTDSFSLKAFANIINPLKFDKVLADDVHSNVSCEIIHNLINKQQYECVEMLFTLFNLDTSAKYDAVVAPDKGATEKAAACAKLLGIPLIQCTKHRDPITHDVSETVIDRDVSGLGLLIVDDIADGGGTFSMLSEQLLSRGADYIDLYVTHGIFSKGFDELFESVDHIYCFNLWESALEWNRSDEIVYHNIF